MTTPSLHQAVERYEASIAALEAAGDRLSAEQVLEVLVARDLIRSSINLKPRATVREVLADMKAWLLHRKPRSSYQRWLRRVKYLDARLNQKAETINRAINLQDWQLLLHQPERDWLWLLQPPTEVPFRDRFDWLWQGLSIAFLTISLSLLTDIAMRFFEGGPDALGAFAVIVPSVLGLLTGGGALTKTGKQAIEDILSSLRIARHWWDEVNCLFSLFLLMSLITFWMLLPQIARIYEARADVAYRQGHLINAEAGYNRALKLNPTQLDLHYKLGQLYEDVFEVDRSIGEYQIAVRGAQEGDSYKAHDRLARLYLLKGGAENNSKAVSLINEGLSLSQAKGDQDVLYANYKNLGWARLQQQRYTESQDALQRAIRLFPNHAAAYCLLAQAQDGLKNSPAALTAWEQCLRYANQKDPDEDYWIGLALKRFEAARSKS